MDVHFHINSTDLFAHAVEEDGLLGPRGLPLRFGKSTSSVSETTMIAFL